MKFKPGDVVTTFDYIVEIVSYSPINNIYTVNVLKNPYTNVENRSIGRHWDLFDAELYPQGNTAIWRIINEIT